MATALAVVGLMVMFGPAITKDIAYAVQRGRYQADVAALAKLSAQDHMSPLFRAVARVVKPAVVVVHVKQKLAIQESPMPQLDDFLRRFFGDELPGPFEFHWRRGPQPQWQPKRYFYRSGIGSGVIVDAEHGYVLTNWHVVRGADDVEVILHDGRKLPAEWVRTDQHTDLAVVKIKPDHLIAAKLGDSDQVEVGDWVLAIGAPEGLPQTVTAGIISAKGRVTGSGGYENFLQTDAAINHGNSGGPLVNMRGEVIGINSAIVSRTGVNEGIGLAIPSNMARNIMDQLIDKGKVVRGFLGVTIQSVDEGLARSFHLPHTRGALVSSVAKDSPAARAGLKVGDFIVAVDGKAVENVNDLRNRIAEIRPGRTARLEIYRDGKKRTVQVKIGRQPEDLAAAFGQSGPLAGQKLPERFGLKVATLDRRYAEKFGLDGETRGVVILEVDPASDAADKGLQPGDVITHVEGRPVRTAGEFARALARAHDGARIRVRSSDGAVRFVFLSPKKK
ncbi:MAG: Do family serine endopeptidase [Planctomycetes bacterium]|nr:Do family serine endopeptidase [Planctomycetota bacterium]